MRYFMKFYLDSSIGTVEKVDDSIKLIDGNDEKGAFSWIEVFDKQQLQQAHRAGWEQCQREVIIKTMEHHQDYIFGSSIPTVCQDIADAIANMKYKEPT